MDAALGTTNVLGEQFEVFGTPRVIRHKPTGRRYTITPGGISVEGCLDRGPFFEQYDPDEILAVARQLFRDGPVKGKPSSVLIAEFANGNEHGALQRSHAT